MRTKTKLKVISVIVFIITAHLIVPKIANATGKMSNFTAHIRRNSPEEEAKGVESTSMVNEKSNRDFISPNYGGPDNVHGTGTR